MNPLQTHRQSVIDFDRHDAAATADAYAENVIVHDPLYPEPLRGRDAVRRDYEELFRAFSDVRTSVSRVLVNGRAVAYHARLTGTHDGPLPTPFGEVPPTGRRIDLPAAVFAEAGTDGRYLEVWRYYDVAGLAEQLGLAQEAA